MAKKNLNLKIRVLNKSGYVFDHVTLEKAHSFVRQHRCSWVDDNTIRLEIDSKDEKRMKEEVWEESGYCCYICEKQMHCDHPDLTIDHITPKRYGGSLLKENMACCCKQCNEEKGCRTPYSYTIHLIAQMSAVLLWNGVPVSRHVVGRRVQLVSEMWRHGSQAEEKEKQVSGATATETASSGSHSQSLDLLDQRLIRKA